MAHENALIKQINIGGTVYDIHDASAIHDLSDIESLGLEGAFVYKGTKATVADLPATDNKVGYVYHVLENGNEYVWTTDSTWEEFGAHIVVEHTHDVTVSGTGTDSELTGTATVSGTIPTSPVTGSATVSGSNSSSAVSASGTVTVPKITTTALYGKTNLDKNSVTGVSGSVTASKATAGTAIAISGSKKTVSAQDTTGSVGSGTAAQWDAEVKDGVLSFKFVANQPTTVTLPTFHEEEIIPVAKEAVSITPYTFDDVTVPKAATEASTFVTGISFSQGDSSNGFRLGDVISVASEDASVKVTGTAEAQTWTQNEGTISGTAASQDFTAEGPISGTAAGQTFSGTGSTGAAKNS